MINLQLKRVDYVSGLNLPAVLTAKENVEFIMLLQKWEKDKREQRSKQLLEAVGLGDRLGKKPGDFSGEAAELPWPGPWLRAPAFVLADEPTPDLDSRSAPNLLTDVVALNQGVTFSIHYPRPAGD
ncbi:MAG: hypothetical protein U5L96_17975 [Owenweeksia sp.]|nr:hypothetical protein [Owenweeksia sp.]